MTRKQTAKKHGRAPASSDPAASPAKMGRPCKYETHVRPFLEQVEDGVANGVIYDELAASLGVSRSAFCDYIGKHKELSDAIKRGALAAVRKVGAALFRKAVSGGKDGMGDTLAMIFYLKNRDPENWRDQQDHSVTFGDIADKITEARKRVGKS